MPKDANGNYYVDPAIAQAIGPRPGRFGSSLLGFAQGLSGQPIRTPLTEWQQAQRQMAEHELEGQWELERRKALMSHSSELQNKARMDQVAAEAQAMRPYLELLLGKGNPEVDQTIARHFAERGGAGQSQVDFYKHQGEAERAKGRIGGENELGQREVAKDIAVAQRGGDDAELASLQDTEKKKYVPREVAAGSKAQVAESMSKEATARNDYLRRKGELPFVFETGKLQELEKQAKLTYDKEVNEGKTSGAAWAAAIEQAANAFRAIATAQHAQGQADITSAQVAPTQAKANADVAAEGNRLQVEKDPATLEHQKIVGAGKQPFFLGAGQARIDPTTGEAQQNYSTGKIIPGDPMTGTPPGILQQQGVTGKIGGRPLMLKGEAAQDPFIPSPGTPKLPGAQQEIPQYQGLGAPKPTGAVQDGQVFDPAALEQAFGKAFIKPAPAPTQEIQPPAPQQPTNHITSALAPFATGSVPPPYQQAQPQEVPSVNPQAPAMPQFSQGSVRQTGDGHDLISVIKAILAKKQPAR